LFWKGDLVFYWTSFIFSWPKGS